MKNSLKKVLIVEGNPGDRRALDQEVLVIPYPFIVIQVSTLHQARIQLQENTFQAVVSNFHLADGNGTDLIPAMGNLPLIMLTEEGGEETALVALNAGAYDYLIKDSKRNYLKLLPITVNKSVEQKIQRAELERYRTQLENVVEERTNELIEMYGKLQESEINFRNIFNNTGDSFVITDYDFNFLEANNTLLNRFGVTREFLATQSLTDFLAPAYHGIIYDQLQKLKQGMPSGDIEIEVVAPLTGQIIPFEVNNVPIVFNNKNAILTAMRDITERKSIARRLFETIIQTEEEERSRIARDLHDEIGPHISALKIYTTSFIESTSLDKKVKLAGEMGVIIREVIESIKNISNDMSPHILVNFGLLAAIRSIIDLFSTKLRIELSSNLSDMRFPAIVESVIYRILKELVNNTLKHAQATNAYINIVYSDIEIVCNYRDDGIGFNWQQQVNSRTKGMGISNIISRTQSLGGDFEVRTEPGQGFGIKIVFKTHPINDNSK